MALAATIRHQIKSRPAEGQPAIGALRLPCNDGAKVFECAAVPYRCFIVLFTVWFHRLAFERLTGEQSFLSSDRAVILHVCWCQAEISVKLFCSI